MPLLEPVVLEGRGYSLRHVGPKADLWPNPPVALTSFALLNQPTMVARPLPLTNNPNSPDMVSGLWTGRLIDAGEFSLTFPNKEASDGVPWRDRFDDSGKNQWIEIRNDGYLESCGCIEKIDLKRDQITVSGHDGMFQTKSAYERDWICVQAPHDVIERGTQVWVPVIADDFPIGTTIGGGVVTSPSATWTASVASPGSLTVTPSGGLAAAVGAVGGGSTSIDSGVKTVLSTGVWFATATHRNVVLPNVNNSATIDVFESTHHYALALLSGGTANLQELTTGTFGAQVMVPTAISYTLTMESDGEWVTAFVNGLQVGSLRRLGTATTSIEVIVSVGGGVGNCSSVFDQAFVKTMQPFLQRGTDKGDYVLPGDKTTYPWGGLHGRYFNNLDLQSNAYRIFKIHSPPRTTAFAGSGASEYANQQDVTIAAQANPLPGAATSGWSAMWFGSIYLKLSAGDYSFKITVPAALNNFAVRAWVGKTKFGDQLVNAWAFTNTASQAFTFTVSAAALAGTLPYGAGTVQRDGWYPIKIEYAVDAAAGVAPTFALTNSPAAYTDPGGTAIASGAQTTTVPATSLSPLGCVDQRYQGVSHFDLIQQTANAFGHQASLEPQPLESGLFPGVLAPRIREGQDFDAILEPDDNQRTEGLVGYGNLLDATDSVSSLAGNGAGFQNGSVGQLQALVYDAVTLRNSLFDIQGWQDFSDAAFAPLLQGLLNNQLGLRLQPWQVITGDPIGRPRLANSWPLPSALAQMRWRPGDGMRVFARDIKVQDVTPRQILTITRQIHPNGSTGTSVGFAARPRTDAHVMKQVMFQATRWQRNYQRQLVNLTGLWVIGPIGPGADGAISGVVPLGTDIIVRALVRVNFNQNGVSFNLKINGVDQTVALSGPWTTCPVNLNIDPVAVPDASGQLYAVVHNNSGVTTSQFNYQFLVDVLR